MGGREASMLQAQVDADCEELLKLLQVQTESLVPSLEAFPWVVGRGVVKV